jgi:hypothetical protein
MRRLSRSFSANVRTSFTEPHNGNFDVKIEPYYSPLVGFDFKVLDDPEFQEDSVREDIIAPILRELGYAASGENKIIRSRRLMHPFVSIGSASKRVEIVPDYVMEVGGTLAWVLEAKGPKEDIRKSKHVEQAYSYAIHSEVRVPYFALCNGREFVLYHVSKLKPVLDFPLIALPSYWENFCAILGPQKVLSVDLSLKKDLGLHLKRLGFEAIPSLVFPDMPIAFVHQFTDNHFSVGSGIKPDGGESYVATFDFDSLALLSLRGKIPDKALQILQGPLNPGKIRNVQFGDAAYVVTVDCRIGDTLVENEKEIFLPMRVNRFL